MTMNDLHKIGLMSLVGPFIVCGKHRQLVILTQALSEVDRQQRTICL